MKKALKIIGNVLTVLIAALAVIMTIFTIFSMVMGRDGQVSLFGVKGYIVQSDSMRPEFAAGDVIFSTDVEAEELAPGDIITFISRDRSSYGQTITHSIRKVITEDGELAFITYGIATGVDDETSVAADDVLGIYSFRIAGLGNFFTFLKSVPGYICCILLPFLVVIGLQVYNIVSVVRAGKAEKRQLEQEERDRVRQLEDELERLRSQVTANAQFSDNAVSSNSSVVVKAESDLAENSLNAVSEDNKTATCSDGESKENEKTDIGNNN